MMAAPIREIYACHELGDAVIVDCEILVGEDYIRGEYVVRPGSDKSPAHVFLESLLEAGEIVPGPEKPASVAPLTVDDVKAEARRRILDSFPEWKQLNIIARGVELQDIWRERGGWSDAEQAEAGALRAAWAWIKAIRERSNELEVMAPIPMDFKSDAYWNVE